MIIPKNEHSVLTGKKGGQSSEWKIIPLIQQREQRVYSDFGSDFAFDTAVQPLSSLILEPLQPKKEREPKATPTLRFADELKIVRYDNPDKYQQAKGGLSQAATLTSPTLAPSIPNPSIPTLPEVTVPVPTTTTVRETIGIVAEQAFQISLVTYLLLLLVETIKEQFVTYFFNLNILLGIVIVSGIIMAMTTPEKKEQKAEKPTTIPWQFISLLSIGAALLVYYKTAELRGLSLLIAGLTGVIIFLLSFVLYSEEE